jgi:FtsP/CotA-like multicopper oxidase with cupredoxin domain
LKKALFVSGITRRETMKGGAAALGLLAARPVMAQPAAPNGIVAPKMPVAAAPAQGAALRTMVAAPLKKRLRSDLPLERAPELDLWAFDGVTPGPVIRLKQGEPFALRVENRIEHPLALHWHGVRNLAAMDGVGGFSQTPIKPGESFDYRFTPPDSGTFLYRPLVIGGSGELNERGLSGLFIVEEAAPPQADHDIAVLVDDWLLRDDGTLAPFAGNSPEAAAAGRLGSWMTVNGRSLPERLTVRPGSRVRIRIANAANARVLRIRFDGVKANVLAVDGQPTDTFEPLRGTLPFPPGTRYDLMIDMPDTDGAVANIMALVGPGLSLVRIAAQGKPMREANTPLPEIVPLAPNKNLPPGIRLQNAFRADLIIEGGAKITPDNKLDLTGLDLARPWTFNGRTGDITGKPLFTARRGQPVVLAIDNRTGFSQPIHLHGHTGRLLHPLDDGWEPYFLDTVQIPENRKLHVSFVADNPGRWLVSSTILDRFDAGLWTWFEVT